MSCSPKTTEPVERTCVSEQLPDSILIRAVLKMSLSLFDLRIKGNQETRFLGESALSLKGVHTSL